MLEEAVSLCDLWCPEDDELDAGGMGMMGREVLDEVDEGTCDAVESKAEGLEEEDDEDVLWRLDTDLLSLSVATIVDADDEGS